MHSSLGVNSVKELVDYVKANPGLGYATSGVGSNQHVVGAWFAKEAGLKMDHVPYRGAGQAINDLIAAHVKLAFLGPTALMPHYKAGTIKLLAQSASKRAPTLQEVPTLEEAATRASCSMLGMRRSCRTARRRRSSRELNDEMNEALKDPKLLANFTTGAVEPIGGTPEEIGKLAQADSVKYARLVKELNIKTN